MSSRSFRAFSSSNLKTFVASSAGIATRASVLAISALCSSVFAGPEGGAVVGGAGTINHSGNTTTINQSTDRMAIDWNSYNVGASERVHYIQPDSTSVSLNRVLSNSGSAIHGRIDANGQVFLINPNGVIFGENATINTGGFLASGLNIDPADFMNGDFAFSALDGTDGLVINNGLINAATGGSISLIGQQVENTGLINAQLGSVNLAAGKEAVVTFDAEGLVGVRVTEAVMQDDLGVDPAIINSGEITVESGQILISASVSQDIFSGAVNSGDLDHATSVVVDEDGSFTLGGGADVLNTGNISVSGENAGDIVVIGENITSEGIITADSDLNDAGSIEVHSNSTTKISNNGVVSAVSNNGFGGDIKLLGNRVGLFDESSVDASGTNGGGEVLIGGDYAGKNRRVRNAELTYIDSDVSIKADAELSGDGGRVINWSDRQTYFYGDISVRGGGESGDGGFVEVSGKENLVFLGNVDRFAANGVDGTLLLDPRDIVVRETGGTSDATVADGEILFNDANIDGDTEEESIISASALLTALSTGPVILEAWSDVRIEAGLDGGSNTNNLSLYAGDDISFERKEEAADAPYTFDLGSGNLYLLAGDIDCDFECSSTPSRLGRGVFIDGHTLTTTGNVTIDSSQDVYVGLDFGGDTILNAGDLTVRAGGGISFSAGSTSNLGVVNLTSQDTSISTGGSPIVVPPDGLTTGDPAVISNARIEVLGTINTSGGNFTATGPEFLGSTGFIDTNTGSAAGTSGNVVINSSGAVTLGDVTTAARSDCGGGTDACGNFTISAGGDVTQNADTDLLINGLTTINAAGFIVDFDNTDNDFSQFTVSSAEDIRIRDIDDIELGALTATGNFSSKANRRRIEVNAVGDITQTDSTVILSNNDGNIQIISSAGDLSLSNVSTLPRSEADGADGPNSAIITLQGEDVTLGSLNTSVLDEGSSDSISVTVGNNFTLTGAVEQNSNNSGGPRTMTVTGDDGENIFTIDSTATYSGASLTINGGLGSDTFNLNAPIAVNALGASGAGSSDADSGNIFNIGASVTGTIEGENGDDMFNIMAANVTTTIDGNNGSNTLTAFYDSVTETTEKNIWAIGSAPLTVTHRNAADDGNLGVVTFSNIDVLQGAAGVDEFDINEVFTGALNGGDGADEANYADVSDPVNLTLGAAGISEIETLTGNNTASTLTGDGIDNAWVVSTENDGSVNAGEATEVSFFNFNNLVGGAAKDTFTIADGGSLTGTLSGGGGTQNTLVQQGLNSSWELSGTAFSGSVDDISGGFSNIYELTGSGSDELTGRDVASTWTLGTTEYTVETTVASSDQMRFSGMDSLVGGSEKDIFNITDTDGFVGDIDGAAGDDEFDIDEVVTGTIDGDAGADIFDISANVTNTISGGAGADIFTILAAGVTATVDGETDGGTLTAFYDSGTETTEKNVWTFNNGTQIDVRHRNADDDDNLGVVTFSNINTLAGGSGVDEFDIVTAFTGSINGNGGNDVFDIDAVVTGRIDGDGGNDVFLLDADVSDGVGGNFDVFGDTGQDRFELNIAEYTGVIDGGGANDTFNINAANTDAVIDGGNGAGDIINLTDNSGANAWIFSSANTGTLDTDLEFSDINTINAADVTGLETLPAEIALADDTFTNTAAFTGTIDARGGDNDRVIAGGDFIYSFSGGLGVLNAESVEGVGGTLTVTALAADTVTWTIFDVDDGGADYDGVNDGSVSDTVDTLTFLNFANLTGGDQTDVFDIQNDNDGSLSGTINGVGGTNELSISQGTNSWTLTDANIGTLAYTSDGARSSDFSSIQLLTGGNGTDTLTGRNNSNFWDLGVIGGQRSVGNNADSASADDLIVFTGMETLTGGNGVDLFDVDEAFTGTLNGGSGEDVFELSDSVSSVSGGVDADTYTILAGDVSAIISGASDGDTLQAFYSASTGLTDKNIWAIDTVSTLAHVDQPGTTTYGTITFSLVDNLDGGAGVDEFNIESNFTGVISGGLGSDDFDIDANVTGSVNGDEGIDNFTLNANVTGDVNGGTGNDVFVVGSSSSATLNGGADIDTFTVDDTLTGSINGGAGNDVFNLNADVTLGVNGGLNDDTFELNTLTLTGILAGNENNDDFNINLAAITATIEGDDQSVDGEDTLTLTVNNAANQWDLAADNSGTLDTTLAFSEIEQINGASTADDTFQIADGFSADVDARGGTNDSVIVDGNLTISLESGSALSGIANVETAKGNGGILTVNAATEATWTIGDYDVTSLDLDLDGSNDGTVSSDGESINFIDFANLSGGDQDDTFQFLAGGSVTGLIDGGSEVTEDSLDYSGLGLVQDIQLGTDFSDIEDLVSVDGSILRSESRVNTWTVDGTQSGSLTSVDAGDSSDSYSLSFSGFNNIQGNSEQDIFIFEPAGAIATMNAAGGDNDIVDVTGMGIFSAVLSGTTINNVSLAEVLRGTTTTTLTGLSSGTNTWTISNALSGSDGINDGELVNGTSSISFLDVGILQGTDIANDIFTIESTGGFSGTINAGTGSGVDSFSSDLTGSSWALSSSSDGVMIDSSARNITFTGMETLNGSGTDTLTGPNLINYWNVTSANSGTLSLADQSVGGASTLGLVNFSGMENLLGGSNQDYFIVESSGSLTGSITGTASSFVDGDEPDSLSVQAPSGNVISWTVSSAGGTVNRIASGFTSIESLVGSAATDNFLINSTGLSTTIDGAGGLNDAIQIGHTAANNWIFTTDDDFNYSVDSVTFQNIEIARGNDNVDTVTANDTLVLLETFGGEDFVEIGETFNGDINTGDENDEVFVSSNVGGDIDLGDGADTIRISDSVSGTVDLGLGNDIAYFDASSASANITGGGGSLDEIRHQGGDSALWELTSTDSTVEGITFNTIELVYGSSDEDTINVVSDFVGRIFSLGNTDTVTLGANVSDGDDLTVDVDLGLGNDILRVANSAVTASVAGGDQTTFDTLNITHTDASSWIVDGANSSVDTISFDGFEFLQGNDAIDTFAVDTNFAGRVETFGGDDVVTLSANIDDGDALTTDLDLGSGNDTLNVAVDSVVASVVGGTNTTEDTLNITHTNASNWIVNGANSSVDNISFDGFEFLQGNDAVDTFAVNADFAGRIETLGGNDLVTLSADIDDGDALTTDLDLGSGNDTLNVAVDSVVASVAGGTNTTEDTLNITHATASSWIVNGANSSVDNISFDGFELLQGNDAIDTVVVNADLAGRIETFSGDDVVTLSADIDDGNALTTDLDLGAGNDILNVALNNAAVSVIGGTNTTQDTLNITHTSPSDWIVDGANSSVDNITFDGFEFLQGNNASETLAVNTDFAGRIEMFGGDDVVTLSADIDDGDALTTDLDLGSGSDTLNVAVDSVVASVAGGASISDTLNITHTSASNWIVNGANSSVDNVSFDGFEILLGNNAVDTIAVNTDFAGRIETFGGNDVVTLSANIDDADGATTDLDLGNGNDILNVAVDALTVSVDGGGESTFDTLNITHATASNWTVDGANSSVDTISFEGFEFLQGNDAVDTVAVNSNFTGRIQTFDNDDIVTLNADVDDGDNGTIDLDLGDGNDTLNIAVDEITASVSGGADTTFDTLNITHALASDWVVDGTNSSVDNINFDSFELLLGNDSVDTVTVESNFSGRIETFGESDIVTLDASIDDADFTTTDLDLGGGDDTLFIDNNTLLVSVSGGDEGSSDLLQLRHGDIAQWEINTDVSTMNNVVFNGFETLMGSSSIDTVNVLTDFFGTIYTNNGNDIIRLSANVDNGGTGTADILGQGNDDEFYVLVEGLSTRINGINGIDTLVVSYDGDSEWLVDGSNNGSLVSGAETISFINFENLQGGSGNDEFTVAIGADIDLVSGQAPGTSSSSFDTLIIDSEASASTDWTINGNSTGFADGVDEFNDIENLTGGEGSDTFTFLDNSAEISGLIDGGELISGIYDPAIDPTPNDSSNDILDLSGLDHGIVVELGEDVNAFAGDPEGIIRTGFDLVNAHNFEELIAPAGSNPEEATNWVAVTHSRDVRWDFTEAETVGINNGFVEETLAPVGDVVPATPNTRTLLRNFGSLQGGTGTETEVNIRPGETISGTKEAGSGSRRIVFSGTSFSVADITDRVESVSGNGNTLLRVVDNSDVDSLFDFDLSNLWLINDDNQGTFRAEVDDANPDGNFSFDFTGVNQLQGGAGNDVFVFSENGNLTSRPTTLDTGSPTVFETFGSINGGSSGTNTIDASASAFALNFGLNELVSQEVIQASNPSVRGTNIDVLENRSDLIDVTNISVLAVNPDEDINTRLLSGNTEAYTWLLGVDALGDGTNFTNTLSGNGNDLDFTGVDVVEGGNGNDSFDVQTLATGYTTFDGNGGTDFLDLTNIDDALNLRVRGELVAADDVVIDAIETLNLSDVGHTLYATDADNAWAINNVNDGLLTSDADDNINFINVRNLVGGNGSDDFEVSDIGNITGSIDGGEGTGENAIDVLNTSTRDFIFEVSDIDHSVVNLDDTDRTFIENIDQLDANTANNNLLIADNQSNLWEINEDDANLNGMGFSGFEYLLGGDQGDIFVFNTQTVSGLVDGGVNTAGVQDSVSLINVDDIVVQVSGLPEETYAGNANFNVDNIDNLSVTGDNVTLLGENLSSVFTIDSVLGNTLVGEGASISSISFSGFQNLAGGSENDSFVFAQNVDLANFSFIDGGGGLLNSLDISAISDTPSRVSLDASDTEADLLVSNLSSISASDNADNLLVGFNNASLTNEWIIDGSNTGSISGVNFDGFANILGGDGIDEFVYRTSGVITGLVDGGSQPEGARDIVDIRAINDVVVSFGGDNGFVDIEEFVGSGNNATLESVLSLTPNTWNINSANSGTVSNSGNAISFSGFDILRGSNGADNFTIENGGGVTGFISGGAGNNNLDINLGASGINGSVIYDGSESASDEITVTGGTSADRFDVDYFAQTDDGTRLVYQNNNDDGTVNNYRLNYEAVETFNNNAFIDTLSVNGVDDVVDTVTVANNSFYVEEGGNRFADVTYENVNSLTINGEAGDVVSIIGTVSIDDTFTVANSDVIAQEGSLINAVNGVRFDNTGNVGTAEQRVNIQTVNLMLDGTREAVYLDQDGDVNILQMDNALDLIDISSSGSVTSDVVLQSDNQVNLVSGGDILLRGTDGETNRLTGLLNLDADNDIELSNSVTTLGAVDAVDLVINAGGNVSDSEDSIISVGSLTVNGDALNSEQIILDGDNHQFNNIAVQDVDRVFVQDTSDNLVVGGSASGDFIINATGNITTNEIAAADIELTSSGGAVNIGIDGAQTAQNSFQLSGASSNINSAITVTNGSTPGALSIDGGVGDVTINDDLIADGAGVSIAGNSIEQQSGQLSSAQASVVSLDSTNLSGGVNIDGALSIDAGTGVALRPSGSEPFSVGSMTISGANVELDRQIGAIGAAGSDIPAVIEISESSTLTTTSRANITAENFISNSTGVVGIEGSIIASDTIDIESSGQTIILNGALQSRSLSFDSGDDFIMGEASDLVGEESVSVIASNEIALRRVDVTGLVSLESRNGAIVDVNDDGSTVVNIVADSLVSRSVSGFGATENPIETEVNNMDILNLSGSAAVTNLGDVNITGLRSDGRVQLINNDGNVTLLNQDTEDFVEGSENELLSGAINGGTPGVVVIEITDGSLGAEPAAIDSNRPEIIASSLEVSTTEGFGINRRRLILYVNDELIIEGSGIQPRFAPGGFPASFIVSGDLSDPSVGTTVNDLLIQVETAGDIDPEVFNDLRNFSFDNVSILMPRDQRYDEEDDEEDEEAEADYLSLLQ